MATLTTNLSDVWSRRAALARPATEARAKGSEAAGEQQANGRQTANVDLAAKDLLKQLGLTAGEVKSLTDKGLRSDAGFDKSVLNLVRLNNPVAGWTVLIGLIEVTPPLAQRWLKNNFRNRPVSTDVVEAYARDAAQQQWITTHQGVAFNDIDQLIDGQHRLMAILKSGVACVMMASFGWPAKIPGKEMTTMDAVDRGRPRSVGDQLKIQHGMKDGTITAQICASLANLCCAERCRRLSVGNTLDVFRAFEPAVMYVIAHRSKAKGLRSAGVLSGFAFALMTENNRTGASAVTREGACAPQDWKFWDGATPVSEMFRKLNQGEKLDPKSALGKLHAFLTSDDNALFNLGLNRGMAVLVSQALYLEVSGGDGSELAVKEDGINYWRGLQPERIQKVEGIFKLVLPGQGVLPGPGKGTKTA